MEVLITGGTGFVGRHLCDELVDRGHEVIAMSRDPAGEVVPDQVDLRRGDVTEFQGLPATIEGVDAVVHLVALSPLYRPSAGETMHEPIHVQGTRNLVRAMDECGVDRLLHMSAIGADPEAPTAFLRAKGRAEGIVRSSDLAWTIVRPAVIYGDGAEFVPFVKQVTTPYLTGLPGGGRTPFQPIWIGDVVDILADALEADRHVGETYEIGGPEVLSLEEVTRIVHTAAGRSVRILPVPMPLAGLGLTIAPLVPFVPFGRDQYRSLRLDHTLEENDVTAFDREPADLMRFEAYVHGHAPASDNL